MRKWQTARAWAAVHATRPALSVMAIVAPASLFFAQSEVEDFGLVRLFTPVSILLLLPALAGVGAAMACENTGRLALPDPVRAIFARAAWAICWTFIAQVAVGVAVLVYPETNWSAIARNVLLHVAIGLLVVRSGYPHLLWLPSLAYSITCIMFGYARAQHDYYWWAIVMKSSVTVSQMLAVCLLFTVSMLAYILRWRRARQPVLRA